MAETTAVRDPAAVEDAPKVVGTAPSARPGERPNVPLNQIYVLPAPIRTFPLPTFYPNNPISLLYLAIAWLRQVLRPPPAEPSVVHTGVWDPETRSVHVREEASIRALWEQGFYGKGSLSRSEPNWLKRELARRGSPEGKTVSEARTELRREERRLAKWERAKVELEAIERQRLAEAAAASLGITNGVESRPVEPAGPVAPSTSVDTDAVVPSSEETRPAPSSSSVKADVAEPASEESAPSDVAEEEPVPVDDAEALTHAAPTTDTNSTGQAKPELELPLRTYKPPVGPAELLALPNSLAELNHLLGHLSTEQSTAGFQRMPPAGPTDLPALPNSLTDLCSSANGHSPKQPPHEVEVKAPVGPAELLALPNSLAESKAALTSPPPESSSRALAEPKAPVGPIELLQLPNSQADLVASTSIEPVVLEAPQTIPAQPAPQETLNGVNHAVDDLVESVSEVNGAAADASETHSASSGEDSADEESAVNGDATHPAGTDGGPVPSTSSPSDESASTTAVNSESPTPTKRRKSVRFSPTVQSTTFVRSDPPSPNHRSGAQKIDLPKESVIANEETLEPSAIENKEHFQLAPEEAFFLAFSLGALRVVDPVTGSPISTEHLLSLFRAHSYFPPRAAGSDELRPDDPFLIHYVVYHHFRSLGWVPRHGIKFGVDWILYQRGPVFDHSEFGIMVMPAYSDAGWEDEDHHEEPRRSWSWLMGVNRVLSHVLKSLVLVYVDVPSPRAFDEEMKRGGIAAALKRYKIREVMVRRFSVNRNR
ncbi:hypothetical protein VTJ49DRAFT_458 [Mycothermus thermophilus]|uniref:tRNA-intron lyase n=1 Tax=Humicola insolens TaxID=85995 RepID=A0ABR3VGA6_HUMIN